MMKFYSFLLALVFLTSSPAQDEPAAKEPTPLKKISAEETTTVQRFQKEMAEVKTWFTGLLDKSHESEANAHQLSVKLAERMAKLNTDGLPKDLVETFAKYTADLKTEADLFKGMPEKEADIMEWAAQKFSDPKFIEAREAASEQSFNSGTAFRTVGAAYGLTKEIDLYDAEGDGDAPSEVQERWVVILAAYKNFPDAKTEALAAAKATKIPFSMNGMIFDKKGLRHPENSKDEVYAGEYLLRRFNSTLINEEEVPNHISVEKSEAYEGFTPGYYIVVGNIAETKEAAEQELAKFLPIAKQAYIKKTKLFLGCLH